MDNPGLYETNVQRWAKFCFLGSVSLPPVKPLKTFTVPNANGEANLKVAIDGKNFFLHSLEDASIEAKEWFDSIEIDQETVLFVYGIGLGYAYDAAQEWLRKNKKHTIVFIEDNIEVIQRFLETETASRLLHDKQAWLEYINWEAWEDFFFSNLLHAFCLQDYIITALPAYTANRTQQLDSIHSKIAYWMLIHRAIKSEYLSHGKIFFENFYKNILQLPSSYQAKGLFGMFNSIPAIICGAGPSLDKNLSLVEKLGDRAIIFAGATALNAVNSNGFVPHFGVGIDPNPQQATRLIANKAYEVPFLYRNRMNHKAFTTIHGDSVYVTGSNGYRLSEWFEEKLNIKGHDVNEGCNVVNFSLSIALAMGCNPIILVGVDLAYSDKKSYHSGVASHPTNDYRTDFTTKRSDDDLVEHTDIYGNKVNTLWKWIAESNWYGEIAKSQPALILINSTEGGIGMPGIPNRPLYDVIKHGLTRDRALRILVHGEIQNNMMPPEVTTEKIESLIQTIQKSFKASAEILQTLKNESEEQEAKIKSGDLKKAPVYQETPQWLKLVEEPSYIWVLKDFNDIFSEIKSRDQLQLDNDVSDDAIEIESKKAGIHTLRYDSLYKAAAANDKLISEILAEKMENKMPEIFQRSENYPTGYSIDDHYSFGDGDFQILDPELKLSFKEKYVSKTYENGNGRDATFYPSGKLKMEQFLKDGKLHGPATFYKEDGTILAQGWFVHGLQQGKTLYYHSSGQLHSRLRYLHGNHEGPQEYYYKDGTFKSVLSYSKGKLHGDILLYYPSGRKKRELHFINGKRDGMERMWSPEGQLIIEVEYKNDHSYGTARTWYKNGKPAQETLYDASGKAISLKQWDKDGLLAPEKPINKQDYFDQVALQANLFTESLDMVNTQLHNIAPFLIGGANPAENAVKEDLLKLDSMLKNLHSLNKDLLFESGASGDNPEEAIWKTPNAQKEMQKKLAEMSEKLKNELQQMQDVVKSIKPGSKTIPNNDKETKQK